MRPHRFRFSSSFNLAAPQEQVRELLTDLASYSEWWPQVRAVARVDDDRALVVCRSALPYDLDLELTAVNRELPVLEVAIDGPIRGWARYHLSELPSDAGSPGGTAVRFEQEVHAEARLLKLASYAARPLLTWNHHQMMRGAEQGLRAVLGTGEPGPGQPRAATAAS